MKVRGEMRHRLRQLDERAQAWMHSRAVAKVGWVLVGFSIVVWILTGLAYVRDDGGEIDTSLEKVLVGVSLFTFFFVVAGVGTIFSRRWNATAEGKNAVRSALLTLLVTATLFGAWGVLVGKGTVGVVQALVVAVIVAGGRYLQIRRAHTDR